MLYIIVTYDDTSINMVTCAWWDRPVCTTNHPPSVLWHCRLDQPLKQEGSFFAVVCNHIIIIIIIIIMLRVFSWVLV